MKITTRGWFLLFTSKIVHSQFLELTILSLPYGYLVSYTAVLSVVTQFSSPQH